jgi:hypothetical protein
LGNEEAAGAIRRLFSFRDYAIWTSTVIPRRGNAGHKLDTAVPSEPPSANHGVDAS